MCVLFLLSLALLAPAHAQSGPSARPLRYKARLYAYGWNEPSRLPITAAILRADGPVRTVYVTEAWLAGLRAQLAARDTVGAPLRDDFRLLCEVQCPGSTWRLGLGKDLLRCRQAYYAATPADLALFQSLLTRRQVRRYFAL